LAEIESPLCTLTSLNARLFKRSYEMNFRSKTCDTGVLLGVSVLFSENRFYLRYYIETYVLLHRYCVISLKISNRSSFFIEKVDADGGIKVLRDRCDRLLLSFSRGLREHVTSIINFSVHARYGWRRQ